MANFMIVIIFTVMIKSVQQFLNENEGDDDRQRTAISLEVLYTLLTIYLIFIIGFGLIYFVLSYTQEILIVNEVRTAQLNSKLTHLFMSFYFSGVTLLTIGYGDIIPVGIGRFIAIIQALIGYILPTTFVLKLVQLKHHRKV